jgi:uncharacterized protein (TIGR02246 family)
MSTSSQSIATADDVAVRRVPERTREAWSAFDADAFAAEFSPTTNVVIIGTHHLGRDAVRAYISAAFNGSLRGTGWSSTRCTSSTSAPDIALIVTEGGVLLPGENEVAPERAVRGT